MFYTFIASDGSAVRKGDSSKNWYCSAGYAKKVFDDKGEVVLEDSKVVEMPDGSTINQAELTGLEMAIDSIGTLLEGDNRKDNTVIIAIDSKYTQKSVTSWFDGWKRTMKDGVAHTRNGTEVKNFDLITKVHDKLVAAKGVQLYRVNSHIDPADYHFAYHEFCAENRVDMPESAWLIMVGLNDTIDKMVTSTTDKMRQTDFKKITEGGNFHGL